MSFDKKKSSFYFIILLWLLVQLLVYYKFGIISSVDTDLYIFEANQITDGFFPEGRSIFYLSYIFILALLQWLHIPISFVVIIQVLFSGVALMCIYKITASLSQNNFTPFVACILYIICFKIHQWNMIIYTDSMFTSCCIISLSLIYFSRSIQNYCLAILFIIFASFLRPNGIVLISSFVVYFYFTIPTKKITKIIFLVVFCLLILIGLNFMMANYIKLFIDSYSKAEIIYPNVSLFISTPNNLYIPNSEIPILQLLLFIAHNFFYFVKLMCLKGFLFLIHAKPYYSVGHNLIIIAFLVPTYFFALKGVKLIVLKPIRYFCIIYITLQVLITSLTSENWDGRFLFPILPFIFILASFGITRFVSNNRVNYLAYFEK